MQVQPTTSKKAELTEIFSSIQGEGLLTGARQVFIRFHGCNLCCEYCDTKSDQVPENCLIESTPGRKDFTIFPNPVALDLVLSHLDRLCQGWPKVHHSISLTGGEPLLSIDILKEWLPHLAGRLPLYLETNGVMHAALESIIQWISHISMDIKLPSTSGHAGLWDDHARFLDVGSRTNIYVKLVVADSTEEWEIFKACDLIRRVSENIPLILQPVTRFDNSMGIGQKRLFEFQEISSGLLENVRVIPQTHKFMGLL